MSNETVFVSDDPIPGADNFAGKVVAIGKGFDTLSFDEAGAIVRSCGGYVAETGRACDFMIVSDTALKSEKEGNSPKYLLTARAMGLKIIGESEFWELTGLDNGKAGANRWVLVDPRVPAVEDPILNGQVKSMIKAAGFDNFSDNALRDLLVSLCRSAEGHAIRSAGNSNGPAWDNAGTNVSVAPFRLYIQRWTKKSVTKGVWKVVACGPLVDDGYPVERPTQCFMREESGSSQLLESFGSTPWYPWRVNIGSVVVSDEWKPKSCAHLFDGLERCADFDLRLLDTSDATSMESMFRGCSSVKSLMGLGHFKTGKVSSMARMFADCLSLRIVDMSDWDFSRVKNVDMMFCSSPKARALLNKEAFVLFEKNEDVFEGGLNTGPWAGSSS